MKKLLLLLFLPSALSATICIPNWIPQYAPELRLSYYIPNSEDFRDVYTHNGFAFDFDLNVRLHKKLWLWEGIGYMTHDGTNEQVFKYDKHQRSHIELIPITSGVKIYHCLTPYSDVFIGVGARWNIVRIHNIEAMHKRPVKKKSTGVAVIGGFRLMLDSTFFVTPFGEYSHNALRFRKSKNNTARRIRDVGMVKIGMGFGAVI